MVTVATAMMPVAMGERPSPGTGTGATRAWGGAGGGAAGCGATGAGRAGGIQAWAAEDGSPISSWSSSKARLIGFGFPAGAGLGVGGGAGFSAGGGAAALAAP